MNEIVTARKDSPENIRSELIRCVPRHEAVRNVHRAVIANAAPGNTSRVSAKRAIGNCQRAAAANGTPVIARDVTRERALGNRKTADVGNGSRIIERPVVNEGCVRQLKGSEVDDGSTGGEASSIGDRHAIECQISPGVHSKNTADIIAADRHQSRARSGNGRSSGRIGNGQFRSTKHD